MGLVTRSLRLILFAAFLTATPLLHARTADFDAPVNLPGWAMTLPPDPATAPPTPVTNQILNVLDYIRAHVTRDTLDDLAAKIPRYNRLDDFGGWIKSEEKGSCLDTRGEVLTRSADPSEQLGYAASGCTITTGLWHDPYAGLDFKQAKAVQIDHVVPLKHIYLTAAAAWAPEKRCSYANFLHNDFHLLAVSGHENMSKGDGGPERYLPPNDAFVCEYVANWVKVKTIWQAVATEPEMKAIEEAVQTHHCSDAKFEMDQAQLKDERDASDVVPSHCQGFGTTLPAASVPPAQGHQPPPSPTPSPSY